MARMRRATVVDGTSAPPVEAPRKRQVASAQIERAILLRIVRHDYEPGQRIPTCEALAAELGANKNTVSKAYRSLAQRGYLLSRPGFGTFISRRPVRMKMDSALDNMKELLSLAAQEAKLSGLDHAQFQKFFDDVVAQAYRDAGARIGFIECNRHDATMLSRDLQIAISRPVAPLLMDEVVKAPARFLKDYDILAVNITHLSVVESAVGTSGIKSDRAKVVGVHIPIDPDSLVQVARLRKGTKVGIVCDLRQTLLSLKGMVEGYNPSLTVDGCLSKERAALRRLQATSDVLLVTPSASERIRVSDSQVPVITLAFRLDARSVEHVSTLIARHASPPTLVSAATSRRVAARAR